jgi:hypothetical protein
MWLLIQSLIIFAVLASNIHWHWTPNGYLASGTGIGLAWLVTQIWNDVQEPRRRKRFRRKKA